MVEEKSKLQKSESDIGKKWKWRISSRSFCQGKRLTTDDETKLIRLTKTARGYPFVSGRLVFSDEGSHVCGIAFALFTVNGQGRIAFCFNRVSLLHIMLFSNISSFTLGLNGTSVGREPRMAAKQKLPTVLDGIISILHAWQLWLRPLIVIKV